MSEQKSPFRFAERCLYNYQLNLSKIKTLGQKLEMLKGSTAVKVQNYEPVFSGGEPSRPVEEHTTQICDLEEQIAYCERCTSPITRMIEDLEKGYDLEGSQNSNMLRLLRLRYFAKGKWPQVAGKLCVSEETLRRWRRKLVAKAIEYLCL